MKQFSILMCTAFTALTLHAETTGTIGAYTLSPEPGTYELLKEIKITFPDTGIDGIDVVSTAGITLTNNSDPSCVYKVVKTGFLYDNYATLTFGIEGAEEPTGVTKAGEYTLHIPEGAFVNYFDSSKANGDINVTYTAEKGYDYTPPTPPEQIKASFDNPEVTPAANGRYGSLKDFSITFPGLEKGIAYPLADGATQKITLQRKGDETVYTANSPIIGGKGHTTAFLSFITPGTIYYEPLLFTQEGEYVLTIGAGAFAAEGVPEVLNPELSYTFFVDPKLNFAATITPDPDKAIESLSEITVTADDNMTSLEAVAGNDDLILLSLDATSYPLQLSQKDEKSVVLTLPTDAIPEPGDWTLTIPAGKLQGKAVDSDLMLVNSQPLTAVYKIRKPETFQYNVTPADGDKLDMLSKISVEFYGDALKQVTVNNEAGLPSIAGASLENPVNLSATLSGKSVDIRVNIPLEDGEYTISIPKGYIVTTDNNNLSAPVEAFSLTYSVEKPIVENYRKGMLMLNEGWFGHDNGSVNFIPENGPVILDAFQMQNPGHSFGTTTASGQVYGDRIYVVSKQDKGGALLTCLDAKTLRLIGELHTVEPEGTQPQAHAFCAVSKDRGFLSTSKGLFEIDLEAMKVVKEVSAEWLSKVKFGEMQRYGDELFIASQGDAAVTLNLQTGRIFNVDARTTVAFTVTADGSLYAVTLNESAELAKINPVTLDWEDIDIDAETSVSKVQNPWQTWRMLGICADKTRNCIYFVPQGFSPRSVTKFDLDTRTVTPDFITLPGKADGLDADQIFYGQGLSIDPSTGYLVANAVEAGYGSHYAFNRIYFFDPADGKMIEDKTIALPDYYWFPAMMLYPDFEAPQLSVEPLTLSTLDSEEEKTTALNLRELTTLPVGNKWLVNYTATSADEDIATISRDAYGQYTVTAINTGATTLTITAEFQGLTEEITVPVSVNASGVEEVMQAASRDVYTTTGILLLRNASDDQIRQLPAGIYIIGGKKTIIR